MPDSKKNKHIQERINWVAGIIAGITDLDFPEIPRKDFYRLKEQLYSELQEPLKKLEAKIENSLSVKSKQFVQPLKGVFSSMIERLPRSVKDSVAEKAHSVASSSNVLKLKNGLKTTKEELDNYFSATSIEDLNLRIELVSNLFFLFNLLDVINTTNTFNNLELIESRLKDNLEKLKLAFKKKLDITLFNEGYSAVRRLRKWTDLETFHKNDPLQIFLYELDLFVSFQVSDKVRDTFFTYIESGIGFRYEINLVLMQINASLAGREPMPPIPPPRRKRNPAFFTNDVPNEVTASTQEQPSFGDRPNP
ncbi:MAG: hypothetical protein V4471_01990 [Pseudomonadota bacterium]